MNGSSALFDRYLHDFARVERFYPGGAPFDLDHLAERARAIEYPAQRRGAMASELARQNPQGSAAAAQFDQAGTVAVVTGQQVGLLGGPLLGVHKAMTAVLLAERLSARGVRAVPIFWMATQDHDLVEVNQAWVCDESDALHRLSADFNGGAASGFPVGSLTFHGNITAVLEEAERLSPGAWEAARACYQPGATMAEAFGGLLRRWFEPWGLLVFDPRAAAPAHALWQPYYLAALDRQPELAELLAQRAGELTSAGYHVQVEQTGAASMLFLEEPQGRLGLRRVEGNWLLGESAVDGAELRARIAAAPGRVSPAALLRPVLQDVAFPTVAQVVGPAETAYLAQSAVLYPALEVRQPVAWPRARVTLLDARAQRLLQKNDLTLEDLAAAPARELLARRAIPDGIEARAAGLRASLRDQFAGLARELQTLDPTLLDAAQGAGQKIEHQLQQLEARIARALGRRGGEIEAQARHLDNFLFPEREPQERVLASAGMAARAPGMFEALHAGIDPLQAEPQPIRI